MSASNRSTTRAWCASLALAAVTLLTVSAPSPASAVDLAPAAGGEASRCTWRSGSPDSPFLQVAAGEETSCSCGGFSCKGKEYPACAVKCLQPQTAVCNCGFCERSMGSANSGALGPVANDCACR